MSLTAVCHDNSRVPGSTHPIVKLITGGAVGVVSRSYPSLAEPPPTQPHPLTHSITLPITPRLLMINSVIVRWLLTAPVNKLYRPHYANREPCNMLSAVLVSFTIYLMFVIFRSASWRDVKAFLYQTVISCSSLTMLTLHHN